MSIALSKFLLMIAHTLIESVDSSCYLLAIKCTGFKSSMGHWSTWAGGSSCSLSERLWDLEFNSVIVVRFATNRVILIVNLYLIVNLFTSVLMKSSHFRIFLWNDLFLLGFLGYHILSHLYFCTCMILVIICLTWILHN